MCNKLICGKCLKKTKFHNLTYCLKCASNDECKAEEIPSKKKPTRSKRLKLYIKHRVLLYIFTPVFTLKLIQFISIIFVLLYFNVISMYFSLWIYLTGLINKKHLNRIGAKVIVLPAILPNIIILYYQNIPGNIMTADT